MTTSQKLLLGFVLATSFAPYLGYLLLGLIFLPMQLALLFHMIVNQDPEWIYALPIILPTLGGLVGVAALQHVVSRVLGLPVKSHNPRLVLSGLIIGLLALIGSIYVVQLPVFAVIAASVTVYMVYLDREYLFGGPAYEC